MDIAQQGERLKAVASGSHKQPVEKWPIYGHGIGLYWDLPEISTVYTDEEIVLLPGMTLGIEAMLTFNGVGSAGFEQNLIVTELGTEVLTTTPMFF